MAFSVVRHGKGVGLLWSGAAAAALFGLLAQILFARTLGPAQYGVIAAANAIANLLGPLAAFGVGLMLVQKHASEGWAARRWVAPGFRFVGFTTLVATCVFLVWALTVMPRRSELLAAILMLPLTFSFAAIQLAESRFQLEQNYGGVGRWHVLKHVLLFTAALAGTVFALGLFEIAALIGLSALTLAVSGLAASRVMVRDSFALRGHGRRTPETQQEAPPSFSQVFHASWPFAASSIGFLFLLQASLIAVQLSGGNHDAGIFGLAISIVTTLYLLPRLLYQRYFLARVSRWHYHEPERVVSFAGQVVPFVALLSAPAAVLIALSAPIVLPYVFGRGFNDAVPALQILCLAVPFRFLSSGFAITAVETDQVKKRAFLQVAFGLAAAFIVIATAPYWGITGAAAIVVTAEIGLALLYWLLVLPGSRRATPPKVPPGIA
jgi:O-antigen/teichoic acid export membrane protein